MAYQIMIIDDNKNFLDQITSLLKNTDYIINGYGNNLNALVEIGKNKPDLIVLDIKEEERLGVQLVELINSSIEMKDVPLILIVGLINQKELESAMKICNIIRYFERPVNPQELISEVRSVLSANSIAIDNLG